MVLSTANMGDGRGSIVRCFDCAMRRCCGISQYLPVLKRNQTLPHPANTDAHPQIAEAEQNEQLGVFLSILSGGNRF